MRSPSRPTLFIVLLSLVSLAGYTVRSDISVAQEYLAPDLQLTLNDIGTITAVGFQLAYAVFQIPAGFLGDRYGARLVLGVALVLWGLASLGSALVPAGAAFAPLFAARFLLGAAQAATYPVGAMAVAQAVPPERRATANAYFICTANLGAALTPLLLAPLMVALGWRAVFLASAALSFAVALLWFFGAPATRPVAGTAALPVSAQLRASAALLRDRNLLLISAGYMLHSAVFFVFIFWFFRYLTEGRGFSVLASGFWGSLPTLAAFLLSPIGGLVADRLSRRWGRSAHVRVPVLSVLIGAVLVVTGANLPGPVPAILALSLSVAFMSAIEGPLWTAATSLRPDSAGAAGGVLNFMGNVGGIISIWGVPRMKDAWGWTLMLGFWAGVAVVAALLWMMVRLDRPALQPHVGEALPAA